MADLAARVAELLSVAEKMTPGEWVSHRCHQADAESACGVHARSPSGDKVVFDSEGMYECACAIRRQDSEGTAYLKNHAAQLIADLAAENRRLREALERELKRLLSIQRKSAAAHWEGCDSSQGHSACYSIKLLRAALAGKDGE